MALPSAPFATAKSIFAGLSVIQLKLDSTLTSVAAEADDDIVTKASHGLIEAQGVIFVSGTGFTGLTASTRYYVKYLSSSTFKLAATPGGTAIDITVDGTAGVFQPLVIFESKLLTGKLEQEMKYLERPDSTGVLRRARSIRTKAQESFAFDIDEAKRLREIFAGALSGRRVGYAQIWTPDPDDASGYCSLVSEADFACTVTREGDVKFGDSDFTKATITLESNKTTGELSWTADTAV